MLRSRISLALAGAVVAVITLAACSSGGSSGGSSSSASGAAPQCSEASIKSAIAPDDQVVKWGCAPIGGGLVAAVQVETPNGYSPTYWLKSGATQWYPADGEAICTESLPQDLAGFCGSSPKPTGSASPTQATSICNDEALTKAASGASNGASVTLDGFHCTTGSDTELAAVKVTDGGLIKTYFFENEDNQWVLVNNSVCQDPAVKNDTVFQEYCK